MTGMNEAASRFLAAHRIAVTGVSREPKDHGANVVYKRLRERGYEVFAVNPNATEVEGDKAYADLGDIPGGVEAVVVGTRPAYAEATVRRCADLGIPMVWMHRAFGEGSVSDEATRAGRDAGLLVIDGGCPCMFAPCSDPGHRVMKFFLRRTGKVPAAV